VTNPQRTLIAVLLDRSGSMESIESDADRMGARGNRR
jgi:hypothetical protein